MASQAEESMDVLYDKAADIAERHLTVALEEGGDLDYLVAIMMVEAAVNAASDITSREDVVRLLNDLVRQIQADINSDPD